MPHSWFALRSTIARWRSVPAAGMAPLGMGAGPCPPTTPSLAAPIRKPVPPRDAVTVSIGVVVESTQYTGMLYWAMLTQRNVWPAIVEESAMRDAELGSSVGLGRMGVFHGLVALKGRHTPVTPESPLALSTGPLPSRGTLP